MLKVLDKLCRPAYLYFAVSTFILLFLFIQNLGTNLYCVGSYQCQVPSKTAITIGQILYVMFWTWLLNMICTAGFPEISWLLILFPVILFFVLLGLLIIQSEASI